MTTKNTLYTRKDTTVFQEIDGAIHILDQKKDAIVTLNETGSFLWKVLSTKSTVETLVTSLTATYELQEKQARADVTGFLQSLIKMGFVSKA